MSHSIREKELTSSKTWIPDLKVKASRKYKVDRDPRELQLHFLRELVEAMK